MNRGGSKVQQTSPRDTSSELVRSVRGIPYSLRGFVAFAEILGIEVEPFQEFALKPYFDGCRELVIAMPKKNGKTTLLSALMLYHLLAVEEADCYIAASATKQAKILYDQASGMIRRAKLESVFAVRPGSKEIKLQPPNPVGRGRGFRQAGVGHSGAKITVLSADAATGDGVIPTLALVDELHRHRNLDLYGVFRDGLGPRNGQMITISTAGAAMASPLGELRAKAYSMANFKRQGTRNTASSPDGSFAWIEWCLQDTDDLSNISLVEKANPASWVTKKWLRERYNSPTMTPGQWARFACGVWTEGEEPWIEPRDWDRLITDIGEVKDGDEVHVALRTGQNAGIAMASPREGGRLAVWGRIMEPNGGGRVPLEAVEDALRALAENFDVRAIYYDPKQFRRSAEILASEGMPMVEAAQSPLRLSQATTTLWRLISSKLIGHDGDSRLRAQVVAGKTKDTEEGWRLVATENTTALIALAIACHQASALVEEKVYWVL